MPREISDDDIRAFLRNHAAEYRSQVTLIQSAVRRLWPDGAPSGGAERVVRVCLGMGSLTGPTAPLLPVPGSQPA
jgi:hypothetical protein